MRYRGQAAGAVNGSDDEAPGFGRAIRYALPLPVKVSRGLSAESRGLARNISRSGVWVEHCSFLPDVGTPIRVEVALFGGRRGLMLRAEVVRHAEGGGFAARFTSLDAQMERALERLLEGLAGEPTAGDSEPPTISGSLALRLGTEVCELLTKIARNEGMDPAELLRECALQGLLKFNGRRISVRSPG